MKKILLLFCGLLCLTGCDFNSTSLDNANIYTTVYPVSYIIDYIYGDNSVVTSIYPNGVNLKDYSLTNKQIEDYSKGDLFIYMGIDNEKELAKSLINKNNKLLIIDATYGLEYKEDIRELWLAPNNFLMLAKNIKNTLNEYLDNTVKEDSVTKKYDELYSEVSWIDAELRSIAKDAQENSNNTLVVSSNVFKYLEHYGFNIISLEDITSSGSESAISDIKNKFKNSKYKSFIKLESEEETELMQDLLKNKAEEVVFKDMITNSEKANDYITMQNENINSIRKIIIN